MIYLGKSGTKNVANIIILSPTPKVGRDRKATNITVTDYAESDIGDIKMFVTSFECLCPTLM